MIDNHAVKPEGVAAASSCPQPAASMPAVAALDFVLREIDLFAQHLGPVGLLRLSSTCRPLRQTALTPTVLQAATSLPLVPQGGQQARAAALRREAAIERGQLRQVGPTRALRADGSLSVCSFAVSPVAGFAAAVSQDLRPIILRTGASRCDSYQLPALPERAFHFAPNLLWSPTAPVLLVGSDDHLQCIAFDAAAEPQWQATCRNPDGRAAERMRCMHFCHGVNDTSFAWSAGGTCLAQRQSGKLAIWHLDMLQRTLRATPFGEAAAPRPDLEHTWRHVFCREDMGLIVSRTPAPDPQHPRQHQGIRLTSYCRTSGAQTLWEPIDAVDFPGGHEVDSLQFDGEQENLYCKTTEPSRSLFVAHISQPGLRFRDLTFWQEEARTTFFWAKPNLAVRPIGTQVAVAGIEGVYLFTAGRLQQTLIENGRRPNHGYAPVWSKNGRVLLASEAHCLHLWDFSSPHGGPDAHNTMPLAAGNFGFSPGSRILGVAIDRLARENLASHCLFGAYDLWRGRLLCERRVEGEGLWCRGRLIWNPAHSALLFLNPKPNDLYLVSTLRPTADVAPCLVQPPLGDDDASRHILRWSTCGNYLYVLTANRRARSLQLRTYGLGSLPGPDLARINPDPSLLLGR